MSLGLGLGLKVRVVNARAIADRGGGTAEKVRPAAMEAARRGGPYRVDRHEVVRVLEVSEGAMHRRLLLGRLRRKADAAIVGIAYVWMASW